MRNTSSGRPRHPGRVALAAAGVLVLLASAAALSFTGARAERLPSVSATVETDPVPSKGDAADDPAVWVHPDDPAASTVIGTDKKGGLAVYDLTGRQLQYLADGQLNNVDVRAGFPLGDAFVSLVAADNRGAKSIAVYMVDPASRRLVDVAGRHLRIGSVYGSCLYHSAATGRFYFFANSKKGDVAQWELFDIGGTVDARRVRTFSVGSQTEGCVADDELGHLYVAEEPVGIWKYGAEPDAGDDRTLVDDVGQGRLTADVEGLTLADTGAGGGYLIASSQGSNSYAVYRREGGNAYVKSFRIAAGDAVDGVSGTDGITASAADLGPAFPHGVFVAQDDKNTQPAANQNFKLVPLQDILND